MVDALKNSLFQRTPYLLTTKLDESQETAYDVYLAMI